MDIDPLTQLSMSLSKPKSRTEQLRLTCCAISDIVPNANRISLWQFNQDKSAISCLALLDDKDFSEPKGLVLTREDFPPYFAAILKRESISASDARNHPDTACFNESYFFEKDIYSLLDYIFSHEFVPFGIICCESVGRQVEWTDEDLENVKRAARIVSIFSTMEAI
ncbi:GAF domain-containing protein [Alteromonas facilis]|uniref:GAF domain-containing protein n=1 Tax=Alteromonas facilis TaxID=2048004 RepID=UPI000C289530|nr:GAF domain-containing protein [Alteromonas facilis]